MARLDYVIPWRDSTHQQEELFAAGVDVSVSASIPLYVETKAPCSTVSLIAPSTLTNFVERQ